MAESCGLKHKTKYRHLYIVSPLSSGFSEDNNSYMVYSCKDSHEDKSVTEKEFTYGFEEAAQWISLAAAYDRDCQWLRFICLVFLGIKGLKTNQWFLPHLLIWLYGSLFQIHIKIWMSEKRAFVESRFHCAWEGKEIPRCLSGRARERKNAGDHRPRRQALSASHFFSPLEPASGLALLIFCVTYTSLCPW